MDAYSIITERIVDSLSKGVVPWRKPWNDVIPSNYITEKTYSGINLFLLGLNDFKSPYWLTWKQIQTLGGAVKKGKKSSVIVYFTMTEYENSFTFSDGRDNITDNVKIPLLKYYRVWNWEQTDLIPEKKITTDNKRLITCDTVFDNLPVRPVIERGDYPCYQPISDKIFIQDISFFKSSEDYYSTLYHETTHWTGHESRLNRGELKKSAFGSERYSKEELVAEMGASFLCGLTGIQQKTIDNSVSYIQSWLSVLKNDKTFVISASAQAQKAVDYILSKGGAA